MIPAVSRIQQEGFPVSIVDVSKNYEAAQKHRIRSVPTFIRFVNGKEVNRQRGKMSANRMEEFCRGL